MATEEQPPKVATRARVRVTIDVDVGHWGSDCGMRQVFQQAADSALGLLRSKLPQVQCTIVGVPEVLAILYPEKP